MKKRECIAWMITASLLMFIGFMAPRYIEMRRNEQLTDILNHEYIRRILDLQTANEKADSATAMLYNVQIRNLDIERKLLDTINAEGYLHRYDKKSFPAGQILCTGSDSKRLSKNR